MDKKYEEDKILLSNIEKNIKINEKYEPYICKVYKNKNDFHIGFTIKIPYPSRNCYIYVLIISIEIKKNKLFAVSFGNDNKQKLIYYYPERQIYKSQKYNIQIIEILPDKDDLHNFLEFNEDPNIEDDFVNKNFDVCIPYYSNNNQLSMFIGEFNKYKINDDISKEGGFERPIILLNSFKVIGINDGKNKDNITFLKYPIFEFIKNEIIITLNI